MDMERYSLLALVVTMFGSIAASGGFWTWMQKKNEKKDCKTQMLLGLAHDRIMYLAMHYIDRGWITKDEYENLKQYLYVPYEKLGGNGTAKRLMGDIDSLPIRPNDYKEE